MRTFFIFQLVLGFFLTLINSKPDPKIYLVDTKAVPRFTQHTSINATKQKTTGNADVHGSSTGNDYFLGGFFKKIDKALTEIVFGSSESSEEMRSFSSSSSTRSTSRSRDTDSSEEEDEKQHRRKSPCSCGVIGKRSSNRIIGGDKAEPHEYPWMVRLASGCAHSWCTGALISDRHIATAFHCLTYSKVDEYHPCDHSDGERKAFIGAQYVEIKTKKSDGKSYPVRKYHFPPHEKFEKGRHNSHDFAIYELDHPIEFNDEVYPICLPKDDDEDYEGEKATAAGWGDYRSGKHDNSDVLRHVELTVDKQLKHYPKMFETLVDKTESGEYKDPCSGDSGGPLMYRNKDDRFILIGTVHGGGYNCDADTLMDSFGDENQKWNRVAAHLDFIKDVIGPDACAWDY